MLLVLQESRRQEVSKDSQPEEPLERSSEKREQLSKKSEADTLKLLAKLLNSASAKGSVSVNSRQSVLLVGLVVVLVKKEASLKV